MTAIAKPPPMVLGVLAIGAPWWLSQRRSAAASAGGAPAPRTPVYYGTQGALSNPTARGYLVPPVGAIAPATNPMTNLVNAAGTLLGNVIRGTTAQPVMTSAAVDRLKEAYSYGGPSTGVYGVEQPILRAPDYAPVYTPDVEGESAARAYYLANSDAFAASAPPDYAYNNGIDQYGGWLDNQ